MFERLIKSFGVPANQSSFDCAHDHEMQLASATLMFAMLPVDYKVTNDESSSLCRSMVHLFRLSPQKSHRLISRAAAMRDHDPSIVAAATLLKRKSPVAFRVKLLGEINTIMRADGVLHDNELDLEHRIERLLGLTTEHISKTA